MIAPSLKSYAWLVLLLFTGTCLVGCKGATQPAQPPPPTVASVEVSPSTATLVSLGETVQLTASAQDANGNTISGKAFMWSSSDESVSQVNASGLVTAVASGSATITATTDAVNGTAAIEVVQTGAQLAIRTEPSGAEAGQPFTVQPVIEVRDANGNPVVSDNTTVVTAAIDFGGGTLGGTLAATAAAGVATFTDLQITGGGGGDRILQLLLLQWALKS